MIFCNNQVSCLFILLCFVNACSAKNKTNLRKLGNLSETAKDGEVIAKTLSYPGIRELTPFEYVTTIKEIFGVDISEEYHAAFSATKRIIFDSESRDKIINTTQANNYLTLGTAITAKIAASVDGYAKLSPCQPMAGSERVCYLDFLKKHLPLVFRSLKAESLVDIQSWVEKAVEFATLAGSSTDGFSYLVELMVSHPYFIQRFEIGEPVTQNVDVFRLTDEELASRLSFSLSGQGPDLQLLENASQLKNVEVLSSEVSRILKKSSALERLDDFHGQWLGIAIGYDSPIAISMRNETKALIEDVLIKSNKPWVELFRADKTFVDQNLAKHYGLSPPAAERGWVSYQGSERLGILGHGSFLSAGARVGDTSPTKRGIVMAKRVLCLYIPPPSTEANADVLPGEGTGKNCKSDKYAPLMTNPGCQGCHKIFDPIGLGLERYDLSGKYRTVESGRDDCPIDGKGDISGVGSFDSLKNLSQLIVGSKLVEGCMTKRFLQFSMGEAFDDNDGVFSKMAAELTGNELSFGELTQKIFLDEKFRFRKDLEGSP